MSQPIKNHSKLLYLQARQLFEEAKEKFENGTIKSEPKLIENVFQSFESFFTSMGKPNMVPRYAPEDGPPWSEDYNRMMNEIRKDLELLFQEVDLLGRTLYTDFNHNMIQHELLNKEYEEVLDKIRDLELYSNTRQKSAVKFGRDDFFNKEKIDYSRISGTPLEIVNGAVTLPQSKRINVAKDAKVSIVVGNRQENKFILGTESNGFPGNNTEIHSVTDDVLTNQNYIPSFLGENDNHSNYATVLDGSPNTWFEYEKVNVREHDKVRVAKNIGWDYHVHENQTIQWAEDPEDGILKLHMQIILNEETTINQVNVNMYVPPSYGAKAAVVKNILVSDGKKPPMSVIGQAKKIDEYNFHFPPTKAKVVSVVFEQAHKYITDIGHIFYEKKMNINDQSEYAMDAATKRKKYAPRVEGPLISLEDLGIQVNVDQNKVEAKYDHQKSSTKTINSIGATINRLLENVDLDTVDMGIEKFEGFRWCIGIRDIEIISCEYEPEGELVTYPFYFDQPLNKISLNVQENIPQMLMTNPEMKYEWLQYFVSIDDGAMWHPITPMDHELQQEDQPPKIYTIREIEHRQQQLEGKTAYLESEYPVYNLRLKIVARRPEDYTTEGFSLKSDYLPTTEFTQSSPILKGYLFNAETNTGTFDSEESDRILVSIGESEGENGGWYSPNPDNNEDQNNEDQDDDDHLSPIPGDEDGDGTDRIKTWIINKPTYQLNKCPDKEVVLIAKAKSPHNLSKVEVYIDGQLFITETITESVKEKKFEWVINSNDLPNSIGDKFDIKVVSYDITQEFDVEEFFVQIIDCEDGVPEGDYPSPRSAIEVVFDAPDAHFKNGTDHIHLCEEDWLALSEYRATGYARSDHKITRLEFYEKGVLKEAKDLLPDEQDFIVHFEFYFDVPYYQASMIHDLPKIIAFDQEGRHGTDLEMVHIFHCDLQQEKKLKVSITNKKDSWCQDEEMIINFTATGPEIITKIECYIDGVLFSEMSASETSVSQSFIIPESSLLIGSKNFMIKAYDKNGNTTDTDVVNIIDCTDLPPDQRPTEPSEETLQVIIDHKFSDICECDAINIYGSIQGPDTISGKTLRINGVSVDPNNLGIAPSDDPCGDSVQAEVAYVQQAISSKTIEPDPEDHPEAFDSFGEWLEKFEEKNNCGCKKSQQVSSQSNSQFKQSFVSSTASENHEESFYWTIPYWKVRELGGAPGSQVTVEVEGYDLAGSTNKDTFSFMVKDCETPEVDENGNPRVRECWQLESVVVQFFDHITNQIQEKTIPSNVLPFEYIDNGVGSKVTVAWRKSLKAPVVMVTGGYDQSGYAFQIHAVGINYLDEYNQSKRIWSTSVAEQTEGCSNVSKMLGDPQGKDLTWVNDIGNGDYTSAPSLGQINDYVTLSLNNDWISKSCPVESDFSPMDNEQPTYPADPNDPTDPRNDEVKPELYSCIQLTHVIFQYYDDASNMLRLYKIDISTDGKDTYSIPTKNGQVTIAVGWSEYFQGPVIQNMTATGADNVLLTSIGFVYRDIYGDAQTTWSTESRYKTNGAKNQDFALGDKKMLTDIPWISNDIVNYTEATYIGKQGDLMAFSIARKIIDNLCVPEKNIDESIGVDPLNPPDVPEIQYIDSPEQICVFEAMGYLDATVTHETGIEKVEYGISVNGVGIVGPIFEEVGSALSHTVTIPLDPTGLVAGDTVRIYVTATSVFGASSTETLDLLASNCDIDPPVATINPISSSLIDGVTGKICYNQINADGTFCIDTRVTDDMSGVDRWTANYNSWSQSSTEVYPSGTLDTGEFQICVPIDMPNPITETTTHSPKADIVFIVDTSGSMNTAITNVKTNLTTFVDHLIAEGIDAQAGYIGSNFNDDTMRQNLIDISSFSVDGLATNSGGWESMSWGQITNTTDGGMSFVNSFREGSNRYFIVITDTYITAALPSDLGDTMNNHNIKVSFVCTENVEPDYVTLANDTEGLLYNLNSSNFGANMQGLAENIVETSQFYPDSTHTIILTAWDKSGKSDQTSITLEFTDCSYDPVQSLSVTASPNSIEVGETLTFTATANHLRSGVRDVTSETTFTETSAAGSLSGNVLTATAEGTVVVEGSYLGLTDIETITVTTSGTDETVITNEHKVLARLKWGQSPNDMDFHAYVEKDPARHLGYDSGGADIENNIKASYSDADGSMYLNFDYTTHDSDADYDTEYEVITINGFAGLRVLFHVHRYTSGGTIDESHPPTVEIVDVTTGTVVHTVEMPPLDWTTDYMRAAEIRLDENGNFLHVERTKAVLTQLEPY